MDPRFATRLDEMMDQAEVSPELLRDLLPRLNQFVQPFVKDLLGPDQIRHAAEYLMGLVSTLQRKTGEGIAYLHDQGRQGIQKFIGLAPWDPQRVYEKPKSLGFQTSEHQTDHRNVDHGLTGLRLPLVVLAQPP